jgi:hypothetical protein
MLDAWYYYPFGTRRNLSQREFVDMGTKQAIFFLPRQHHHVLFHFDQEPLWNNDFGFHYDCKSDENSSKTLRILANSEISDTKKNICRERQMLDWYFFFHGFAALDWFRDGQYFNDDPGFKKTFCSLNHLVSEKKSYRMSLVARLVSLGLHEFGDISFHAYKQDCINECRSEHSLLTDREKTMIANMLESVTLPLTLHTEPVDGNFSAHYGHGEHVLWQKSLWHVVNETVFYDEKLHLTEKIFKPIVARRPFILVAAPGNLRYLRRYGFKTFGPWIDESYDEIVDPSLRLDMIALQIKRLCKMSRSQLNDMYQDMQSVLEHNKQHFFGEFKQIIVNELVDNFDACVRVWNNGRIDGRQRPRHPDLESVKRLLSR